MLQLKQMLTKLYKIVSCAKWCRTYDLLVTKWNLFARHKRVVKQKIGDTLTKVSHLWKVQKVVTMNIVCFPDYTEWPRLVANMTIPCTWSPWHHKNGGSCGKQNNMPRPIIRSVWQTKIFSFHQRMLAQTHAHENSNFCQTNFEKVKLFS